MAYAPLVQGVQREIWRDVIPQNGGVSQTVPTGIRISAPKLPCVRGLLTIDTPTGSPVFTATPQVGANGFLEVVVANTAAPGNSGTWTLDVELVQSPQQANRGTNGYILVSGGATSGLAAPQTLAETYDVGGSSANQTMTVTDAHGGGVIIDTSAGGFVTTTFALDVRQPDLIDIPVLISRRGDIANAPRLHFVKARGSFAVPDDDQAGDHMGQIAFYGRIGGAFQVGAEILADVISVAGGLLDGALDFYASQNNVSLQVARMQMDAAEGITTFYNNPLLAPDTTNTGRLGSDTQLWSSVSAGHVYLYHSSDNAVPAFIDFFKSRGALGAPTAVQTNDLLGSVDFYGYNLGAYGDFARVLGIATNVGAGPGFLLDAAIDVYATYQTAPAQVLRIGASANGALVTAFGATPVIRPFAGTTGSLGVAGGAWDLLYVSTANVYANVCLGATAVGGGALETVALPNTCTMPVPQANQVYLGAKDFTGTPGTALATFAISAEEPVQDIGEIEADKLIPLYYNGRSYLVLAFDATAG